MTKKILLRVPDELVERIDKRAAIGDYSRNAWLVKAIEWALEQPVTKRTREERV